MNTKRRSAQAFTSIRSAKRGALNAYDEAEEAWAGFAVKVVDATAECSNCSEDFNLDEIPVAMSPAGIRYSCPHCGVCFNKDEDTFRRLFPLAAWVRGRGKFRNYLLISVIRHAITKHRQKGIDARELPETGLGAPAQLDDDLESVFGPESGRRLTEEALTGALAKSFENSLSKIEQLRNELACCGTCKDAVCALQCVAEACEEQRHRMSARPKTSLENIKEMVAKIRESVNELLEAVADMKTRTEPGLSRRGFETAESIQRLWNGWSFFLQYVCGTGTWGEIAATYNSTGGQFELIERANHMLSEDQAKGQAARVRDYVYDALVNVLSEEEVTRPEMQEEIGVLIAALKRKKLGYDQIKHVLLELTEPPDTREQMSRIAEEPTMMLLEDLEERLRDYGIAWNQAAHLIAAEEDVVELWRLDPAVLPEIVCRRLAALYVLLGVAARVKLDRTYTKAWNNLGTARVMLGDAAGAREAFENTLKHDPQNGVAQHNLAMLLVEGIPPEHRRVRLTVPDGLLAPQTPVAATLRGSGQEGVWPSANATELEELQRTAAYLVLPAALLRHMLICLFFGTLNLAVGLAWFREGYLYVTIAVVGGMLLLAGVLGKAYRRPGVFQIQTCLLFAAGLSAIILCCLVGRDVAATGENVPWGHLVFLGVLGVLQLKAAFESAHRHSRFTNVPAASPPSATCDRVAAIRNAILSADLEQDAAIIEFVNKYGHWRGRLAGGVLVLVNRDLADMLFARREDAKFTQLMPSVPCGFFTIHREYMNAKFAEQSLRRVRSWRLPTTLD